MKNKILVVEDDTRNMRLIEMTLRAKNYTLLRATDGEEALNMATEEKPDLIIMDIRLPKMSGLEVTEKLKKMPSLKHTLIIGITAYAMKGDKEKVIAAGCDAYVSKPINTRELPEMIAELLSKRRESSSRL